MLNVEGDNKPAGFILVSSFLDEIPIIMWADRGIFNEDTFLDKIKNKQEKLVSKQIVWFGGIDFGCKLIFNDGTTEIIDDTGYTVPKDKLKEYPNPNSENKSSRDNWNIIKKVPMSDLGTNHDGVTNEDPTSFESNYSSIVRNYIWTNVNQGQFIIGTYNGYSMWSGCSPTAGSNVMKYWADKGYSSLNKYNNPTNYQYDIVRGLRTTMNTFPSYSPDSYCYEGSTYISDIPKGLTSYARNNGLSYAESWNLTNPSFNTCANEIDMQRVAVFNMRNQEYLCPDAGHSITLVGYKKYVRTGDANSYYLVVRNNWNPWGDYYVNSSGNKVSVEWTENIWLRYGTWGSSTLTVFTPSKTL